jgi:membrane-bound lytic murein transglycosylase D
VRFWEKIFFSYPATTVVVHESSDPDRIIDVIDYRLTGGPQAAILPVPRKLREAVTSRYLARYNKAAARFVKEQANAVRYGSIEQRLYDVYHTDPVALQNLYTGNIKLRAQTGLADDFLVAAKSAAAYLPHMEQIFNQYQVPKRLTRLPFVESMFNLKAVSKVGASGIWQFMPATARNYIFVNKLVDERNAPEKATRAAAQFLLSNFQELGQWPLAITAYNHGKEGMARAARQLGTRDIGKIIDGYVSPSFGFASRNFYAEFLAASNVYERLVRLHPQPETPPVATASVLLKTQLSVAQLLAHTSLTKDQLHELNPCLLPATLSTHINKPLPAFYEIKVPLSQASAIRNAVSLLETKRYAKK